MESQVVRVVMNGVTGRMGYNQHLVRPVLAINDDGGMPVPGGRAIVLEQVLVGRDEAKLRAIGAGLHVHVDKPPGEGRRVEVPAAR